MDELKTFLYEYLKKGRLKESMEFFWNIIIVFQDKSLDKNYPYLDELKSDLVLKSSELTELKKRKQRGTITAEEYSTVTRNMEKRFLNILNDELNEIPSDFSDYCSRLDYDKVAESIHERLIYSGDNTAVITVLPYVNKIGQFILNHGYYILAASIVFIIGYLSFDKFFANDRIKTTTSVPIIVSIYPNDKGGFGELHFNGLTKSIEFFESKYNRKIKIISLNQVSLNEMKNDDIGILIDRLNYLIESENIIAIHGPPVTECTNKILRTVYESGKNIPVFVTSAVPKNMVQWSEIRKKVPLFRLSSGVDDRAEHIGDFIDDLLIRHKNKMIFLVEENDDKEVQTFGEKFYAEIDYFSKNLNKYQNNREVSLDRIEVIKFKRSKLSELVKRLKDDKYLENDNVIYLLGVGSQYKYLVEELYKKSNNSIKPVAQFGGWMNSYAIDKEFRNDEYYLDKLFEITDLYIDRSVPLNERQRNFQELFNKNVSPALRDQAFSFDVGFVIYETYNEICEKYKSNIGINNHLFFNEKMWAEFEQSLGKNSFKGVSGIISLDLNRGGTIPPGKLQYSRFDSELDDWSVIEYNDIFK